MRGQISTSILTHQTIDRHTAHVCVCLPELGLYCASFGSFSISPLTWLLTQKKHGTTNKNIEIKWNKMKKDQQQTENFKSTNLYTQPECVCEWKCQKIRWDCGRKIYLPFIRYCFDNWFIIALVFGVRIRICVCTRSFVQMVDCYLLRNCLFCEIWCISAFTSSLFLLRRKGKHVFVVSLSNPLVW